MATLTAPLGRNNRPGHIVVRSRFFDLRINVRVLSLTGVALILLLVAATWTMTLGSFRIPFFDVVRSVYGQGTEDQEFVVRTLRLPRVLAAILTGAALAMAGAIFQGLVRNPLVSPDIIGIDAGASVVAVFWLVTGRSSSYLSFAAFSGALITAAVIYLLAWKRGISPDRLILVGIGIGAVVSAGTTYLTIKYPVEIVRPAEVWLMGSLYGSNWTDVKVLAGFVSVCLPLGIILAWPLRALQLGDDVTRGLGLPLERTRIGLIAVGCALAAVSVATAGPIGFVALMIPHVARMLAGPHSGSVFLFTGVIGGLFVVVADAIAQHYLPVTLPVGVVTAAVGAPYFLFLLYRSNLRM